MSPKESFLTSIGAYHFFSPVLWKAAFIEVIATALIMFIITTSIIACRESHTSKQVTSLIVFLIFFFFLVVTTPVSGGHMNPLVTFIFVLKGTMPLVPASIYIAAQCIGSISGFLMIKTVMSPDSISRHLLGGCAINAKPDQAMSGISPGTALVLEFVSTFLVLYLALTSVEHISKEVGIMMVRTVLAGSIAMAVFVSVTVTGQRGYTGVGLNPARCLGAAILEGGPLWDGHWVFWVGPFLACIVYHGFSLILPSTKKE